MFFRNVTAMRFPTSLFLELLAEDLGGCTLRPVGALELASQGFVSPFGRESEGLAPRCGDAIWIAVGREERILPPAVVNAELQKRLDEIERSEGRRPGGRTRKRIKDEIVTDLLPRALVRPSRVDAILDCTLGLLFVDTSSRKVAESVASELRRAIGSFPALPLNAEAAPRAVLTAWLSGEAMPDGLDLGDECEVRDALDNGAVVKCRGMDLDSSEIDESLESGKQCTQLALTLDDRVSFVLGEDLVLRKFRMLDGAVESLANAEREDLRAELESQFALMSAELRRVFSVLEPALRLSKADRESATRTAQATDAPPIGADDELLQVARTSVISSRRASPAFLQRTLVVGYNRACRLLETLEAQGVVTAIDGAGHRRVLAEA